MMKLRFDVAKCVRADSKFSQCDKCVQAAPEYVRIDEQLPDFPKGTGVEAAACVGACPTEAFALDGFSATQYFFDFVQQGRDTIAKDETLPCISLLSVEHLIALALASDKPLRAVVGEYKDDERLYALLLDRLEEANFILESIQATPIRIDDTVSLTQGEHPTEDTEDTASDRRDFFKRTATLEGVAKTKAELDEALEEGEWHGFDIDEAAAQKIRDKHLPDKRKILYTVLKRAKKPEAYEILAEEDVSFISQKFVEETCTNCQICYRICPTGALSSDRKFSLIHFDAMLCVKCRLCHDVCEPDAIKLQPGFDTTMFFEPETKTLATFHVRRCNECGNPFTYFGGEVICPRCKIEEEEAMELIMNAKKMEGKI